MVNKNNLYNNPYYNFLQSGPGAMAAYGENIDPRLRGPPPTRSAAADGSMSYLPKPDVYTKHGRTLKI